MMSQQRAGEICHNCHQQLPCPFVSTHSCGGGDGGGGSPMGTGGGAGGCSTGTGTTRLVSISSSPQPECCKGAEENSGGNNAQGVLVRGG